MIVRTILRDGEGADLGLEPGQAITLDKVIDYSEIVADVMLINENSGTIELYKIRAEE